MLRERIQALLKLYPDVMAPHDAKKTIPASPGSAAMAGSRYTRRLDLDPGLWEAFERALGNVPRAKEGPTARSFSSAKQAVSLQRALPAAASSKAGFGTGAIGYDIADNKGGGDCLFYALGIAPEKIWDVRAQVAGAISVRPDDERAQHRNAHQVVSALSQTPATQDIAIGLTYGKHAIPNRVYARLVEIPGIYAGEDELAAYSTLPGYQTQTFLVVDQDGTLMRFRNGIGALVPYTGSTRAQVLRAAFAEADVALYKTPNHWQRITLPNVEEQFGELWR
jgi:hypothetical protein